MNDWIQKEKERETLAASLREGNKAVLFNALERVGISLVHVDFDGCGDSGQVEGVTATRGSVVVELPEDQIDIVEVLVYDFLEQGYDGWEMNDGSYGDFVFNVAARTITLTFNARYSEVRTSEHSF